MPSALVERWTRRLVLCGAVLGLVYSFSARAAAQVATDGEPVARASVTNTASITLSKTIGTGPDRLLLVGVAVHSAGEVASVTYAGVALTQVAEPVRRCS
jgi:hypothetical protein